ncbi:RHOD protein [Geosmithia morbida]|uniref:RHOD protein n=1 Tax=Geosmithia morbida TaxID=1094350 RepID=A0A9P5D3S8_9HYPO|nr:RHOD protein [Geosmithia morbida]KAF4125282.1 RHOD protein [Geosmithia morbida]
MSIPCRTLARPALPFLRTATRTTAQPSSIFLARSVAVSATPRSVAVGRIASAALPRRWYSADSGEWKSYSFDEVTEQIKRNDEIAKGGKGQEVIFVDVREPHELQETGRIPGAINIPIDSAMKSFHISDEEFLNTFGYDRPPRDAHLLFYCKAGVRAKTALALAQHAGWKNVADYPGSWLDWDRNNGEREVQRGNSQWDRLTGKN